MKKLTFLGLALIAELVVGCGETGGSAVLQCEYESTWRTIVNYQLATSKNSGAAAFTTDSSGNIFVAGYGTNDTNRHWIVQKSPDRGRTWSVIDTFQYATSQNSADSGMGSLVDSNGNLFVAGDATTADGNSRLISRKSSNGGGTWTNVDDVAPAESGRGIAKDSLGNLYVVGTDSTLGKMIVRKSKDAGVTWSTVESFMLDGGSSAMGVDIAVDSKGAIFAVGASVASNRLSHWIVRKSIDGGTTWSTVDDFQFNATFGSAPAFIAISSTGALYVGGYGVYTSGIRTWIVRKSTDSGAIWKTVDDYQLSPNKLSEAFAFSQDAEGNVFVAGIANNVDDKSFWVVRKSTDEGTTWKVSDQFQWSKNEAATPRSLGLDRAGNLYAVGEADDATGVKHWIVRVLGCN